ncbi:MAG: hypothetical protein WBL53_04165 [Pseudonocardiaceae bacterium]
MTTTPDQQRADPRRVRSCVDCLAWGLLWRPRCPSCQDFAHRHPLGRCHTCDRELPVRDGVCRLCRKQATLIAKWQGHDYRNVDLTVAARTGHQLFFANMEGLRGRTPNQPLPTAQLPVAAPALALLRPAWQPRAAPLMLCDPPRDCRQASSLTSPRDPALLELLLHHADTLAERYGWHAITRRQVRYGLKILTGCHDVGEPIKTSSVHTLGSRQIPPRRVLEVLRAMDGLLIHDRPDALTVLIGTQFADLPNPMRQELQAWIDVLRHGGPRRRARPQTTVRTRLACIRPFLAELATRYHSLRQVTPDDVTEWLDDRPRPSDHLSALRDLFRVLKQQRLVFANPTSRIHRSRPNLPTPRPLSPHALQQIGQAASTDPVLRLVVALIGVHALRPQQVRLLLLADIDLPNQRIHVDGSPRALDAFTVDAIKHYLAYRRRRWPHTSNPHLLVSSVSTHDHAPVCGPWLCRLFHNLPATATQLRQDRILEEALATGADPLHLAAMFGFAAETGLRYATAIAPQLTTPQP